MNRFRLLLLGSIFAGSVAGCGITRSTGDSRVIIRPAEDTPTAFSPPAGVALDGNSCKSPMTDKRDGTQIIMVTSGSGAGNYRVPEGKYGVKSGELLRLNCRTGEALGIVKE